MKYQSSITHHSKTMVNVRVFADKQMDSRQTMDKPTGQKLYAPDLSMRVHKWEKMLFSKMFSKIFFPQVVNSRHCAVQGKYSLTGTSNVI